MHLNLPDPIRQTVSPLFQSLPLQQAMSDLLVDQPRHVQAHDLCQEIVNSEPLRDEPMIQAGLWLYVDDLERSHHLTSSSDTPDGCYWHAIMHRREGDYSNSRYLYRRMGAHPALKRIDLAGGAAGGGTDAGRFDPFTYLDRVEKADQEQHPSADLLAIQRKEWVALFEWCAEF